MKHIALTTFSRFTSLLYKKAVYPQFIERIGFPVRLCGSIGFPVTGQLFYLVLFNFEALKRSFEIIKSFNHKIKIPKQIKVRSQKANSQKSPKIEKQKKDVINLKDTPRRHILKRNTKITFSIPYTRILVTFEIFHMTP